MAERTALQVRTPESLKMPDAQAEFAALGARCGDRRRLRLILPKPILDAPRLGCFNLHGSLLPRWRGAAPIQRAIMAGDARPA
jgi:methionyl-tRNA formyltransferase